MIRAVARNVCSLLKCITEQDFLIVATHVLLFIHYSLLSLHSNSYQHLVEVITGHIKRNIKQRVDHKKSEVEHLDGAIGVYVVMYARIHRSALGAR